jgi:hypothetical protein
LDTGGELPCYNQSTLDNKLPSIMSKCTALAKYVLIMLAVLSLTGCGRRDAQVRINEDGVSVDAPGIHIETGPGGANVVAPGVQVEADEGGASVSAPGVNIGAGPGGVDVDAEHPERRVGK